MVATLVLEASGEIRVGSSPTWGTTIFWEDTISRETRNTRDRSPYNLWSQVVDPLKIL